MIARPPVRGRGLGGRVHRLAGLAAALVTALAAGRASAYVRYKTDGGLPFYWPQTCIPVSAYPNSMKDANGNMEDDDRSDYARRDGGGPCLELRLGGRGHGHVPGR